MVVFKTRQGGHCEQCGNESRTLVFFRHGDSVCEFCIVEALKASEAEMHRWHLADHAKRAKETL